MEQFFKDAGASRVNEKAVVSLEQELNDTVKQLVAEARLYANYAGRRKTIKMSDVSLARTRGRGLMRKYMPAVKKRKIPARLLQRNRLVHAVAKYPGITQ
jgi:histone H3/H4